MATYGIETSSIHPDHQTILDARACQGGNDRHGMSVAREAFDELVVAHLPHLFRLAKSHTDTVEDAHDLVQDTMVKAFAAVHQFKPGSNMASWLVTILLNTYRDHVRRVHQHPPWVSADIIEKFDHLSGHAQTCSQRFWQNPEEAGIHADWVRHLHIAIDKLPPQLRQIMGLAAIDGRSCKEIAEAVECPIGTVMSRLHRGRSLLRIALQADVDANIERSLCDVVIRGRHRRP